MEQTTTQAVLDGVLKLVQEGGAAALWGLTIYMGFWLLRVLAIGGIICLAIHLLASNILQIYSVWVSQRLLQFPLVSEGLSKRIGDLLETTTSDLRSLIASSRNDFGNTQAKLEDLVNQLRSTVSSEMEPEADKK